MTIRVSTDWKKVFLAIALIVIDFALTQHYYHRDISWLDVILVSFLASIAPFKKPTTQPKPENKK